MVRKCFLVTNSYMFSEVENVNEAMDEEPEHEGRESQFDDDQSTEQSEVQVPSSQVELEIGGNHDRQLEESFDILSERVGNDTHVEDPLCIGTALLKLFMTIYHVGCILLISFMLCKSCEIAVLLESTS